MKTFYVNITITTDKPEEKVWEVFRHDIKPEIEGNGYKVIDLDIEQDPYEE